MTSKQNAAFWNCFYALQELVDLNSTTPEKGEEGRVVRAWEEARKALNLISTCAN